MRRTSIFPRWQPAQLSGRSLPSLRLDGGHAHRAIPRCDQQTLQGAFRRLFPSEPVEEVRRVVCGVYATSERQGGRCDKDKSLAGQAADKRKRPEGRFERMLRREQSPVDIHPLYGSVVSRTTMLNSGGSSEFGSVPSIKPNRVLTILTPIS